MYGMSHQCKFPWKLLSNLLNSLPAEDVNPVGVPRLQKDSDCPPEVMQGPFWAKNFLQNAEQFGKSRNERILSLAHKLAELGHGLSYSSNFSSQDEEKEYVLVDRDDLVQERMSSHRSIPTPPVLPSPTIRK
jgi:hypothetical protein